MKGLESDRWTSESLAFPLVHTAFQWGYLPSQLGICEPEEDLVVMVAYTLTISDMENVERSEYEKKADINRMKHGKDWSSGSTK